MLSNEAKHKLKREKIMTHITLNIEIELAEDELKDAAQDYLSSLIPFQSLSEIIDADDLGCKHYQSIDYALIRGDNQLLLETFMHKKEVLEIAKQNVIEDILNMRD